MRDVFAILILGLPSFCYAKKDLPIPRFVSSRAAEVNLRVGPGSNYPVQWKLVKPDIPLEVTAEFDTWRRVRDWEGTEGWVHQSMLSGQRYGVIQTPLTLLQRYNSAESPGLAKLEQGVIVRVKKCQKERCFIKIHNYEGWVSRSDFWGVYEDEKVG